MKARNSLSVLTGRRKFVVNKTCKVYVATMREDEAIAPIIVDISAKGDNIDRHFPDLADPGRILVTEGSDLVWSKRSLAFDEIGDGRFDPMVEATVSCETNGKDRIVSDDCAQGVVGEGTNGFHPPF